MLIDSKTKPKKHDWAEEKLSQIPTMVSEISRKITDYRQSYQELVKDAGHFFDEYENDLKTQALLKRKVTTYQNQIEIIESYRKEKGKYPSIKGQSSAQRYVARLVAHQTTDENELKKLEEKLRRERNKRYEHLDHLTDYMLNLLNGQRIFSQFIGTIALSTPSPQEKVRHVRNERCKPIYVTALVIALFDELRKTKRFDDPFLKNELARIFPEGKMFCLMADKAGENASNVGKGKPMPAEMKMAYRENVLKPIAKAALLQSIGMNSPEANEILGRERYRTLSADERCRLLSIVERKTNDYLRLGIGIPVIPFNNKEQKAAFEEREKRQLAFTLKLLRMLNTPRSELGDLLRIPMTYASFVLSTKEEFDYQQIYQAYDVLKEGAKACRYREDYIESFCNMVGRFPLGSGLYIVQKDTGEIEKAIVSSLFPDTVDEPICKIITRRQIQFLSHAEVIISKPANLFFEESRQDSHHGSALLEVRYKNEYTWNATDVWETQVPSIEFWKRDDVRRYNGPYNPESY